MSGDKKVIKLFTAAKELQIGTGTIVDFLKSKGFEVVKHPMTILDADMHKALLNEFAGDSITGGSIITQDMGRGDIKIVRKFEPYRAHDSPDTFSKTRDDSNLTDKEIIDKLLKFWRIDELSFVGKLSINPKGSFFNEVRIKVQNGALYPDIAVFPDEKGKVNVYCPPSITGLINNEYYSFYGKPAYRKVRDAKDNVYSLIVDVKKEIRIIRNSERKYYSDESFIKNIFLKHGKSPHDASTIARQLSLNELELYTESERFIFELIQNADDMPNEKHSGIVSVEFVLTEDFLIFMHNGSPFFRENVEAICDAGKSTKSLDTTKTGYKGIGFKSVFSDAKVVYIHSGSFSFRFDKLNDVYKENNFYKLYREYFKAFPDEIDDFKNKEREFTDIKNIPWQIKPIWTARKEYPEVLQAIPDIFKKEVAVCLNIGNDVIRNKDNKGYKAIVSNLFYEPRFLLFLRNVGNVAFHHNGNHTLIKVSRNGIFKEIKTSFSESINIQKLEYICHDNEHFQIEISNEKFNQSQIRLEIFHDGEKSYFKDKSGINIKDIPEKLAKLTTTTISFAAQIEDEKIKKLSKANSILFNYLPTSDTRFEFPFLVNADFITTTNRETIIAENKWNIYLFYNIGYYSIQWISNIAKETNREDQRDVKQLRLSNSVLNLLPKKFDNQGDIYEKFNLGFEKAIHEIAFIPSQRGLNLLKISECLLDKTEIFENDSYYGCFKSLYPEHELIRYSLLYKSRLDDEDNPGLNVKLFEKEDIKKLFVLTNFGPTNNASDSIAFIKFLKNKNIIDALLDFNSILNHKEELVNPEDLVFDVLIEDKKAIEFDENVNFLHPLLEKESATNVHFREIIVADLNIQPFDPVKYISNLINSRFSIDIQNKECNLNFWRFIFKYKQQLSPDIKRQFENFVIWTTQDNFTQLKYCFLSSEFDTTYDIEGIASNLEIEELIFVNPEIVTSKAARSDWRSFFYDCGVKKSEGFELYINTIKPLIRSNSVNENNYLIITQFVYDVYSNNITKFTQEEMVVLRALKLKTIGNGMQNADCCVFADQRFDQILPGNKIDYQVDLRDYSVENKDIQNWKEFFLKIKVRELDELDILKTKIDGLASVSNSVDNDNVVSVWRTLFNYQDQLFNDASYKAKIKGLPVLLKNETLEYINNPNLPIYFAREYDAKLDIESLLSEHYDYFVSPLFPEQPNDRELWRKFFTELGVYGKIATSGTGSTYMISHLANLSNYDFAIKFWHYFQNNFKVSEIVPSSTLGNYIKQNLTIPCIDKITLQRPEDTYANVLKDKVGDYSKVSAIEFTSDVAQFLGIIQSIVESELEENNPILKYYGNLGEKHVYDNLLKDYKNKLGFKETSSGFVFIDGDFTIEVIWNNKQFILPEITTLNDSGLPYDLKIIENEDVKFIEVKATVSDKTVFYMSSSEWDFMRINRTNYYIYRVVNITDLPQTSNMFLAIDAFFDGSIRPQNFPVNILIN